MQDYINKSFFALLVFTLIFGAVQEILLDPCIGASEVCHSLVSH